MVLSLNGYNKVRLGIIPVVMGMLILVIGIGTMVTPTFILQVSGGDGLIADVPADEDPVINVIDLEVDKTGVPIGSDLEIQATIANYHNEEREDIEIQPALYEVDDNGEYNYDGSYELEPEDSVQFDLEPGEIKTFNFDMNIQDTGFEFPEDRKLVLTDEDEQNVATESQRSEKSLTILPSGSSATGTTVIDRDPESINEFTPDRFKDEISDQSDSPLADPQLPPVVKDEDGNIIDDEIMDLAEGRLINFGSILGETGETEIESDGNVNIGIGYESIPDERHYKISIQRNPSQQMSSQDVNEEEVELRIVDEKGNEIDDDTSYFIPAVDSSGEIVNYHLSSDEVDYIQTQQDVYVQIEGEAPSDLNIRGINSMNLQATDELSDLPEPDLQIEEVRVNGDIQGPHEVDENDRINIEYEITNHGSGSMNDVISLREENEMNTVRSSQEPIINPDSTEVVEFEVQASPEGTHEYILENNEYLNSPDEEAVSVAVGNVEREILPTIQIDESTPIAGQPVEFEIGGVFGEDQSDIQEVTWEFDDGEEVRSYNNPDNYMQETYTFEEEATDTTVSVEIDYERGGSIESTEDTVVMDVSSQPVPNMRAIYYDVIAGDRSDTRLNSPEWGGANSISGTLYSGTCPGQCFGEIDMGSINPESLNGLNMMAIDKDFSSGDIEPVQYSTYNFDQGEYAVLEPEDDWTFDGDIQDNTNTGASTAFSQNLDEHRSTPGRYILIAGSGNPVAGDRNIDELTVLGADMVGDVSTGDAYTLISKSTGNGMNDNKALHESHHPSESEEEIDLDFNIAPVDSSDEPIPPNRPVYFTVTDDTGSNFYTENDDVNIDFQGVTGDEGDNYVREDSPTGGTVDALIDLGGEIGTQEESIEYEVGETDPQAIATASEEVLGEDDIGLIKASRSYDMDRKIESTEYNWNIIEGENLVDYDAEGQNFVIETDEESGIFEAEVDINGQRDRVEVLVAGDVDADFDVNRIAASYDFDRTTSQEETFYTFGTEGSISINEMNLQSIVDSSDEYDDVEEAFGEGNVEFQNNEINLVADASDDPSASRYLETGEINLANYDTIYLSYERQIERGESEGNLESGYVSMHIGDITEEQSTFGEPGTIRGTESDVTKTSDVITQENIDMRGNVLELDVSTVTRTDNIVIHARAHSSNSGVVEANIFEMWGDQGSGDELSEVFDHNFYPSTLEGTTIQGTRSGFLLNYAGSSIAEIKSTSFETDDMMVDYSIDQRTTSAFSLETGGTEVRDNTYSDTVEVDSPGSEFTIGSVNNFGTQRFISDSLSVSVDRDNTHLSTVVLDASDTVASDQADFEWSVEGGSVENPGSQVTEATFDVQGSHDVELMVEGADGSISTHTDTVQIDSLPPEIDMNSPDSVALGAEADIFVSTSSNSDIDELKLMMGDGEEFTQSFDGGISYEYDNPGVYQVTAVVRDDEGRTASTSDTIVVDRPTGDILSEDPLNYEVILPTNTVFDPLGDVTRPSNEIQPASIFDISPEVLGQEDDLEYEWVVDGEETHETDILEYETFSPGTTGITLIAEDPAGREDTLDITLEKVASDNIIEEYNIIQDEVDAYVDDVDLLIEVEQEVSTDITVNLPDGREIVEEDMFEDTTQATVGIDELQTDVNNFGENTIDINVENEFGEVDSATDTVLVEAPDPVTEIDIESEGISEESDAEYPTYLAEPIDIYAEAYNPHPDISANLEIMTADGPYNYGISPSNTGEDDIEQTHQYVLDPDQYDNTDFPVEDTIEAEIEDEFGATDQDSEGIVEVHHRGVQIDDFFAINDQGERTIDLELGEEADFTSDVNAPDADEEYRFTFWDGGDSGWIDSDNYINQFTDATEDAWAELEVEDPYGFSDQEEFDFRLNIRESCLRIQENNEDPESGLYFVVPQGFDEPVEVQCDFDYDGGGWTLVLAANGLDSGGSGYNWGSPDWSTSDQYSTNNANFGVLDQPEAEGWKISQEMINAMMFDGEEVARVTSLDLSTFDHPNGQCRRFFEANEYEHDTSVADRSANVGESFESPDFNNKIQGDSSPHPSVRGIADDHYPRHCRGFVTNHCHGDCFVESDTAVWLR